MTGHLSESSRTRPRSRGQVIRGIKVFRNKTGEACDVTQPFVRQVE